jgi:hypothetical protein
LPRLRGWPPSRSMTTSRRTRSPRRATPLSVDWCGRVLHLMS